jgi:CRISPR-associated protein Csd1
LVAKSFLLPRSKGRSGGKSYETTFLLWDHIGYLLGQPSEDKKSAKQHKTWLDSLKKLPAELLEDSGVKAVLRFYDGTGVEKLISTIEFQECLKAPQCNMAFRLSTDLVPVPCRKKVQEVVKNAVSLNESEDEVNETKQESKIGICIITGEKGEIARTHGRTPINKDTKCLVGFQKNCGYDSYGKEQGYNAPVIKSTEFAYVTALNNLLKSNSQRMSIGDASTVFWSEKKTNFESDFASYFSEPQKDDPDKGTRKIKALFESVSNGAFVNDEGKSRFYVLGLAPNAARIAVRFWQVGTVTEFAEKIKTHFEDLEIVKPPKEPVYYSLWRLLANVATQDKSENIPPNVAGDFMRAILAGTPYPTTLLQAALRRIHSDTENRVKPIRAALIKAYLNRYHRIYINPNHKELLMSLDTSQPSIGYQLGRLFATLEKIQEKANPGLNATIRERFYGAACASPVSVFANLLRLKNHHLAKMESKGRIVNFEKLLAEIIGHFDDFPAHLDLHEQGRFAIGYYHQRQDFFTKKDDTVTAQ